MTAAGPACVTNRSVSLTRAVCAAVVLCVALAACDGPDRDPTSPTQSIQIDLSPSSLALEVGETGRLFATVRNGPTGEVVWTSSDTDVAVVDAGGTVTGVAAGSAMVQAVSVDNPSARASASVEVTGGSTSGCAQGAGALGLPGSRSGALASGDCLGDDGRYFDRWTLTVSGNQDVTIDLTSGSFDTYLYLFSGTTLIGEDDDGGSSTNSRLTRSLGTGTYQILATSYDAGETGAYTLSVAAGGGQSSTITIVVTNSLLNPINVGVNGVGVGSVPASDTRQATVDRTGSVTVSWSLVRTTTTQGNPIGDDIGGAFPTISNPGDRIDVTVDAVIGSDYIFAPMIVNQSSSALLMMVNGGLQRENRCNCTVAAGSTGTHIGYYDLFSNSNVRAYRTASGYTGSYIYWDGFASSVDNTTGLIRLTATSAPAPSVGVEGWAGGGGGDAELIDPGFVPTLDLMGERVDGAKPPRPSMVDDGPLTGR